MAWAFILAKTEPSLRARAMRFLARREHSRQELSRKLERIAGEGEDVGLVLDELTAKGWLSDARFAEQSVRAKARRYGPLKVAHELRAKGIDDEAIAAAFRGAGSDGAANIESVWRTRFKAAPEDDRDRARQVRFLQGRGFALDAIFKLLKTLEEKT
jgi:regulatory protein